ncbi:MAG: ROK family protein [Candidatus Krumholzibacteria bacterium]|nr:ROK family protein [Candidatus Krumholzibacteria bacterium]
MNYVLGVDIGGTNIKLGIVKKNGEVLESDKVPTRAEAGPEKVALRLKGWLDERRSGFPEVEAAGLGCAGILGGAEGFLYASPNLPGWESVPLAQLFSGILALPVVAENDANCAAYAEYVCGAGRGTRNFICITLGTGVGGGIIIDGKLHRGSSGFAGEVGHTVIQIGGPKCSCGNLGCLEALIGAGAIVERAVRALDAGAESMLRDVESLTVKDIAHAAYSGDKLAAGVLEETGRFLGIGLANLVHILNPEAVAVGGGVAGAGDFLLDPAREALADHVMDKDLTKVRIVPAELGNRASFVGAALLALGDNGEDL